MNKLSPAGFPLRLLAYLNDKSLLFLPSATVIFFISKNDTLTSIWQGIIILLIVVIFLFLFGMAYGVFFTYFFGGDLGKLLTGLRVRAQAGEKLPFNKILFRQLLSYRFSWLLFGLGFLSIFKDPNKQAWHDKTVDSNVFKVQPLLPLGLITLLVLLGVHAYFLKTSFDNFLNNPAKQEVLSLAAAYNQSKAAPQVSQQISDQQKIVVELVDSKKFDEALKAAQTMLQNSKTDLEKAYSYGTIGDIYLVQGNPVEAKKSYLESLKYSTKLYPVYSGLSEIAVDEKNYQQAEEYIRKSIDINPDLANSYYRLGIIMFLSKDQTQAVSNLEKAIQMDPNNQLYKSDLAKVKSGEQATPLQTNSASRPVPPQTRAATPAPATLNYTQQDIDDWKALTDFADKNLKDMQIFINNPKYDQTKVQRVNFLLTQMKSIAGRLYNKMQKGEVLTVQDEKDITIFDEDYLEEQKLVKELFPQP